MSEAGRRNWWRPWKAGTGAPTAEAPAAETPRAEAAPVEARSPHEQPPQQLQASAEQLYAEIIARREKEQRAMFEKNKAHVVQIAQK